MPAQPASPQTADPHAGHQIGQQPASPATAGPHAGHDMSTQGSGQLPPETPPPPAAFTGPEHAADLFYPDGAMVEARQELIDEHGDITVYKVLVDQAEVRLRSGRDGYFVNAEVWYGGDIDKLWLKSEIEGDFGEAAEQLEIQALWSHALDPWFDIQLGVRHDIEPAGRTHLVAGIQGLAPYWFEVDGAVFLSDKGDVTARFEAEYDLRITQRLILQPRLELNFALQDIPEERLGAGLSNLETGLRLRYEISRQFAPYIGLEYDRGIGDTARFRRAIGEDVGGLSFVAGVRAWF